MAERPEEARARLEDRIEMLRYSVEGMERQREGYVPGSLEWHYAEKIAASCRAQLSEAERELRALGGAR